MKITETDIQIGLNQKQIEERQKAGLVNITDSDDTKSYQQIFRDNLMTLFNLINVVLAGLIFLTGSYKNLMFLGVMLSNIVIGTFQEIRSKRTLDKISLIHTMKVSAVRNGQEEKISISEIVMDDILKIKTGNQVVSDAVVREGILEVDESLLSGESEHIIKKVGDFLYSGSFVVGGHGTIQIVNVGNDNYAAQMVKDAKQFSKYPSELRDTLNKIIKYIGIAIIPLGLVMFLKQYILLHNSFDDSILSISAALIGMIPEGLVILTSIALAVGVIHLAKRQTLVQELYCIETLARVDVLCLDKTGTITEGKMAVHEVERNDDNFNEIMGNLMHDLKDDNATINAMREYFEEQNSFQLIREIPFNSSKKYSGAVYEEALYVMGAYSFMCDKPDKNIIEKIEEYSSKGYRVLTLMKSSADDIDLKHAQFVGNILLVDKIKEDARETLDYFKEQGVAIKIISGDHPVTVSHIAKRVGLENAEQYIDTSSLSDAEVKKAANEYAIFGRVTPKQKKLIIDSLKEAGHCVGMSGDGVNDVLAFKSADVSIAMASGSDVAKSSANLVLLNSSFDALPSVLYEGRRVINNIQRVATLFLTKTIYSILLTFMTLILPYEYPFIPIHLTFVSSFTIGMPAFFMALEPNFARVENQFLENVIKISLPAAVSVALAIAYIYGIAPIRGFNSDMISQLALLAIAFNGCVVLTRVSYPFTLLRKIILGVAYMLIFAGLVIGNEILGIPVIEPNKIMIEIMVIAAIILSVSHIGTHLVESFYKRKKI